MSNLTIFSTPYNESATTAAMRNVPRFGHDNNFSTLFSGDGTETADYVLGLIFIAAFVLCSFLLWSIVLLVFKCAGGNVGFLSGKPFKNPKRAFRVRLVFVNTVLLFILFTVLLVINGITNLQDTLQTVSNTNEEVDSLLTDAQTITASLRSIGESSAEIRDVLVENLGNFCPGDPELETKTGYDFDDLATEAIELLNVLGDFVTNDVATVQDGIDATRETTEEIDQQIENIEVNDWQSLLIIIPFVLIPSFLLVGCVMAWFRVSNRCYNIMLAWFWTPLLILATAFSYIACGVVSAMAVANADFCSGDNEAEGFLNSPDGTIMNILATQDVDRDSITFEAVRFYMTQCITTDPFAFIGDYEQETKDAVEQVRQLDLALEVVTVPTLNLLCDKDFTVFEALVDDMKDNLDVLEANAAAALSLLGCDRITPIYNNAVYGGTCTYSVDGVTWTFASFLVLAFLGTLLLTFRSSVYQNDEEEWDYGESAENYARPVDANKGISQRTVLEQGPNAEVLDEEGVHSDPDFLNAEVLDEDPQNAQVVGVEVTHRDANFQKAEVAHAGGSDAQPTSTPEVTHARRPTPRREPSGGLAQIQQKK